MKTYECLLCGTLVRDDHTAQGMYERGGVVIHSWTAHTGLAGGGLPNSTYLCMDCIGTKSLHEAVDTAWRKSWAASRSSA